MYKKEKSTKVKNYRPVSVLPTVSKIFERLIQKQTSEYINQFLSPFYRKLFSTQTALVCLIAKYKHQLDKNSFASAVLMNLSKAFDTIHYDLLIAKLLACGFAINALDLVYSYLKDRRQNVKINMTFITWTDLIRDVSQGSVRDPLLFNIYLNDVFFFLQDTTLFVCDETLKIIK